MIINCQPDLHLDLGPVTIRAFRSLTQTHVDAIMQVIGDAPTPYSMELHDDYDGYLAILIEPIGHNSPTFLLSGTIERIDISALDDSENLNRVDSFETMEAASARLAQLLASLGA